MKLLPVPALILILTLGLMTSGISTNNLPKRTDLPPAIVKYDDLSGPEKLIRIDTFNLNLIRPSSGVQFYKEGIIFLSDTRMEIKIPPKFVSFGTKEAYFAVPVDLSTGEHRLFSPMASFSYPCEAVTFSSDYVTMYYTKLYGSDNTEKIFMAHYNTDVMNRSGWISEPEPVDFCTGISTFSHPSISTDGQIMVFASDMPGGSGGMDIYFVTKEGNGWSAPKNAGKHINTPGDEFFPSLDQDNNLYFSSDGITGYGGYDVYTCSYNGQSWNKPVNLARPVNSEDDDIAFTINKGDGKTAFFTRRQQTKNKEMMLFRVSVDNKTSADSNLTIAEVYNGLPQHVNQPVPVENAPEKAPEVKKDAPQTNLTGKKSESEKDKASENLNKTIRVNSDTISSVVPTKGDVVYRVQIYTSGKPMGSQKLTIDNVAYNSFEYLYQGAYRSTVGEFSSLAPAVKFQKACRLSGFPQAFVVAFKNNERSLDPSLFK